MHCRDVPFHLRVCQVNLISCYCLKFHVDAVRSRDMMTGTLRT